MFLKTISIIGLVWFSILLVAGAASFRVEADWKEQGLWGFEVVSWLLGIGVCTGHLIGQGSSRAPRSKTTNRKESDSGEL